MKPKAEYASESESGTRAWYREFDYGEFEWRLERSVVFPSGCTRSSDFSVRLSDYVTQAELVAALWAARRRMVAVAAEMAARDYSEWETDGERVLLPVANSLGA